MSLLYWLPMLGSLENQGLSNAQPVNHGATVNIAGKLGSCYDFSGTQQYIDTGYKEELGSGDFSIAAWFKLTDSGSRTYQPIISNKNTAAISVGCAIYYNHSQQKFLWSTADGSSATEVWMLNQYPYATMLNTWHHIVMVRNSSDAKKGYFYIDGVRYELSSVPAIRNVTNTTYNMMIGDICNHASSSYSWTGSICDLRIYDNAISAREAKELSKGLFLHYPLSREGFGQNNLLMNSLNINQYGSDGSYKTIRTFDSETHIGRVELTQANSAVLQNSYRFIDTELGGSSKVAELTTGQNTYTFSFDARITNYTSGNLLSAFDFRTNNIVSIRADHNFTQDELDGNWHRVSMTLTTNNSQDGSCLWAFETRTAHPTLTVIEYKNPKIEIGEKATPWAPHPNDELYYDMGLNTGNTNLLTKSAINPANWQHTYPNCTSYTGDGYDNLFTMITTSNFEHVYLPVTVTANQQYTFSVTYQVLDSFELWQSYRPFSFQVLNAVPTNGDTYNNVIGSILIGNTAMASPQRGSTTFTPTGTTIWLNIPGAYYKDGSTSYNKSVKFSRLKLETGGTATPWVSAESDPDRSGNIVYDVSGFGHNGELYATDNTASFIYETNTPRYSLAINPHSYNSTTSSKAGTAYIKGNCAITNPNQLTIAFWCYARNLGYGGHTTQGVFCTTSMIGDSIGTDYQDSAMNHRDSAINVNMSNSTSQLYLSITFIANEWHHYAFTYDGQYARSYRDGVLQDTKNFSSATPLDSFTSIILGLSRAGGVWRRNDNTYSDLRAYATALSAEDVLALYNAPMSLANNGTLLTQGEFSEV